MPILLHLDPNCYDRFHSCQLGFMPFFYLLITLAVGDVMQNTHTLNFMDLIQWNIGVNFAKLLKSDENFRVFAFCDCRYICFELGLGKLFFIILDQLIRKCCSEFYINLQEKETQSPCI